MPTPDKKWASSSACEGERLQESYMDIRLFRPQLRHPCSVLGTQNKSERARSKARYAERYVLHLHVKRQRDIRIFAAAFDIPQLRACRLCDTLADILPE